MPKLFTVSMFNVGTVPLDVIPRQESGIKIEHFDNEAQALKFATAQKTKYKVVTVKNTTGDIIVKYHKGIEA